MGRSKGRRERVSQALQPKKTQNFKRVKVLHQEDKTPPSPRPPPPSQPLAGSALNTGNPCLGIMLSSDDTAIMVPISSVPSCPTTPSNISIVPYKALPNTHTQSTWKIKKNRTLGNHWNRKKLATLLNHFNPIPFVRERPPNVAAHQLLLTRLGLWSFLHLEFDRNIHSELIKQLVIYYNPKQPLHRRSHVNGCPILLSRATMARALALPTKRNADGNDATKAGPFMVSEEEALFVEELVFSWLVLQDDDCELPDEAMQVRSIIKERKLEDVDWAGLIWFMVKSELLKGKKLVNCYYASHMQLLLKNQKPRLFGDHVENAGSLDTGAAVCDEENVDTSFSGLEGPETVNRGTALFDEESQKERFLDVEENATGVEESGREQKTEITLQRCCKRRNLALGQCTEESTLCGKINGSDLIVVDVEHCEGDKLQDPQIVAMRLPGKLEIELNTTCEFQDQSVIELHCREEEHVTLNDFECKETDYEQGESNFKRDENVKDLEFNSANGTLVNEESDEEGQKIEGSSDFTKQEIDIQQMDLVLRQDKFEKKFGLNILAEDQKADQQSAILKEDGNSEMRLLNGGDDNELSQGVAREDLVAGKYGESPDSQEKKFSNDFECNETDCQQGELTDLEFGSANGMLMDEDCNEGLKIECSSDLEMSGMHILSRQESEFDQMDLVLGQDKGERELGLDVLVEDCEITSEKFCILDEQHATEMEDRNRELKLLHVEDENKLSEGLAKEEERAVKMDDGNWEMKLLQGEDESKQSEWLAKEELFDGRTSELLDNRDKEVSNDFECKQMDYQQRESNCLQDKYGKDLESDSANRMLMNEDTNEDGLKIECSSDLTMGGMQSLSRKETDFQQMDLVLSRDKGETEFGLNVSVENHNVIGVKLCISSEQHAIEMEDGNRELSFQNELPGGFAKDELFDGKTGELLGSQEKKVGFSAEKSIMDSENQHTDTAMEEEKPEVLSIQDSLVEGEEIVKPEASGLNEFIGAEMDLQNKDAQKIEPFVEPFASERDIYMNLADSPFGNSLKREIDCLNDGQFELQIETQKTRGINSTAGESFDLDLCSEQAELWVSRLKTAAHKRAHMDNEVHAMLLKELEEKNQIIEQYEKIRRQEQQKRQNDICRYERELYLMKSVLNEYRTALDEVHKSFAQYIKRARLPEKPVYMDHPDGGGKVILAAELEETRT